MNKNRSSRKERRESENLPKAKIYARSEHSISRDDIDPDALKIMYRLIRHGFKGYLVGGGVRDLLLGKTPQDFDIATDATPKIIKNLFRNCRIIGRRFKLAHIYFRNNKIIEVSTFRDASHNIPETEDENTLSIGDNTYGTPATDAVRRDLTINALFYDLSNFSIIDYVGGIEDLRKKTIRIIGDPLERFKEDPVRMLRVIRHAARADFSIDKETLQAIKDHNSLIEIPAAVRVYEEIKKDLTAGASIKTLRLLANSRLLANLLPELLLNDEALLTNNSYFAQVLTRIDNFSLSTAEETPFTPVLAAIGLFLLSYGNSFATLVPDSIDRDGMTDHLHSCFIKLSVPRKERERIDELLILWLKIHQTPFEKLGKLNLERRRQIENIYYLIDWLDDLGHGGRLKAYIADIINKKNHIPQRRSRNEDVKNRKNKNQKTRATQSK